MSRTNAHAVAVEHGREVVWMNVFDCEAHDSTAELGLWSVNRNAIDDSETIMRFCRERSLVSQHFVHTDRIEIIRSRCEPNCISSVRSSRLEFVRQDVPRR